MENKHLVDIAYDLAKTNFKAKPFNFNTIWQKLVKETKMDKARQDDTIGTFYVDMLEDPRFLFIGKNSWRLKEFVHFDELGKYEGALFNFESQLIEEGFEDIASELESKKMEEDEEIGSKEEDISDEDYGALKNKNIENDEE